MKNNRGPNALSRLNTEIVGMVNNLRDLDPVENNSRIQAAERQRPIISGGIRCSLTSPSSLFAFFVRSLDSAAVKCLECFLLSFGLFSFLKKPGAQAQARRLSMRKQDTHSRSRDCSFPFFQLRLPASPCGGVAHMLSPLELMLL